MENILEDSFFINNIEELEDINFEQIKQEIDWQSMYSQGSPVPRLISIQGNIIDGLKPLYGHPIDKQPELVQVTPTIEKISKIFSAKLHQDFNHVLIQYYRSGNDNIGEHSDKTLDIKHNSNIINYSIGASRTMKFKHKDVSNSTLNKSLKLTNNSVFILGPITNQKYLHSIKQDKRDNKIKSQDELINNGERISFTFRSITTFITNNNKIIGQGAKKDNNNITHDKEEKLNMLKAFSYENRNSNFNWFEIYGNGFNCLDLS